MGGPVVIHSSQYEKECDQYDYNDNDVHGVVASRSEDMYHKRYQRDS